MIFSTIRLNRLLCLVALACVAAPAPAKQGNGKFAESWGRSVVTMEVMRKQYDYLEPWNTRTRRLFKTGVVVGPKQILTTADEFFDRTLVRLQKDGRGTWWTGDVIWVDYPANLALVTCKEENFWTNLKPAALGGAIPADGTLQIVRWRGGNLEARKAEFTRYGVREGQLAAINHVVLEADCDIQGAGYGEPIVVDSHVAGILTSVDGRTTVASPASFVQSTLEAHKLGNYIGLGYLHFFWQPALNPDSLACLGLPAPPRGVLVSEVPARLDGGDPLVRPRDVLLGIDKFPLDIQGDYKDPEFGHLMLENLATRNHKAGDTVKLQLWRDGKLIEAAYCLPSFQYTNSLVPAANFDREPEYLILGGLVFQPLMEPYLQSWGADWKRRAPFRLTYYCNEPPSPERPALVMLSQVLPDPYNIGYQEQRCLVLDKVNGRRVSYMSDLKAALQNPQQGFHLLEFVQTDALRRIVLDAGESEQAATARVLKRYGISEPSRLAR